ncbi:MAG: hypothetical protein PHT69_10690 [Bacteroidales bacterium]|nr:hypothetical protein [Bacteroidales bacterium]
MLRRRAGSIAYDKENTPVFLAENEWMIKIVKESHPLVSFHSTSEFNV